LERERHTFVEEAAHDGPGLDLLPKTAAEGSEGPGSRRFSVTPEQRNVVLGLVLVPGRGRQSSPDDVLRCFGSSDGAGVGLDLLRRAVADRDPADVEAALLVCQTFGFGPDHLPLLLELASANWHHKHEDVIWYLGSYHSPEVVDALIAATEWVPGYLDFDENRTLARKAIWELGKQPGGRAREALERIARSPTGILQEDAKRQLER
jgi:hypothetical protein